MILLFLIGINEIASLSIWLPFLSRQKVKERRVGNSPIVIKGENSQKASLKIYVMGSFSFFFKHRK